MGPGGNQATPPPPSYYALRTMHVSPHTVWEPYGSDQPFRDAEWSIPEVQVVKGGAAVPNLQKVHL